jgi:hypothetical protein
MTVGQYLAIKMALGRETIRVAEEIRAVLHSRRNVPASLWRELIACMEEHSPAVMATPYGRVFNAYSKS